MFIQIAIGTGLLVANLVVMAIAALLLEVGFRRVHPWLIAEPQRPKLLVLLIGVGIWVLAVVTVGVWSWATTLRFVGTFATQEEAVYFALESFTTLGLGDVVPATEWRILAAMTAVNGFLSFGLLTALLVEALRQVRLAQLENRRHK